MINLVGFSQGMREQRDTLNRRRRELAQAFSEFKAANPTATFDEYQSFIDQYAGDGLGSNYLRGGAPSEDVLKTLAEENEKRRRAQEEQQLLDSIRRRAETQGQLQGLADDVLLNMPGDDFEEGYQTFLERLGGEEAEDQFGRERLQSYFGPNRLNTLVNERVRRLTPEINAYVASVDPNSIDAASLSERFNIRNPAVLQPMLDQAQAEATRLNNERIADRRANLINTMTNALQSGRDPVAEVKAVYGNTNINLDSENIAPLLEQARSQFEEDQRRLEDDRRQQAINLRADVENRMQSDNLLLARLRNATREEGLEIIRREASELLTPRRFETAYGGENAIRLEDLYEEVINAQQTEALDRYEEYRRQAQQQARERSDQAVEESVNLATTRNEARFEDDVTPSVARQLARKYRWNDAVQFEFAKLFDEGKIDTDATASEVAIQVENSPEFQAVAVPMNEYRNRLRNSVQPFPYAGMDEALSGLGQSFQQDIRTEIDNKLEEASEIGDPRERAIELDIIARTLQAKRQEFDQQMSRFKETRNIWLKPGQGGWNQDAVNQFVRDAAAAFDELERRLQNMRNEVAQERAAAEKAAATTQQSSSTAQPDRPFATIRTPDGVRPLGEATGGAVESFVDRITPGGNYQGPTPNNSQ